MGDADRAKDRAGWDLPAIPAGHGKGEIAGLARAARGNAPARTV